MTTFASFVLIALFVGTLGLGLLIGRFWGRWEIHNDPDYLARMARRDHEISELKKSLAKVKHQRNEAMEAYRRLKDARGAAL